MPQEGAHVSRFWRLGLWRRVKKVTKRESKAPESSGSTRSQRTRARAKTSETKSTRKTSQGGKAVAIKSATGPKKGATSKAPAEKKIRRPEADAKSAGAVSAAQDSKPKFGNSKDSGRRNPTGAKPAPAPSESASAAGLTETAAIGSKHGQDGQAVTADETR